MLIILGIVIFSITLLLIMIKGKVRGLIIYTIVMLQIVGIISFIVLSVFKTHLVYENDYKRSYALAYVIDRSLLLSNNLSQTPFLTKLASNCTELLKSNYWKINTIQYGDCFISHGRGSRKYDFLWWLGRDRTFVEFPDEAYKITWIRERLDSVISTPCNYIPDFSISSSTDRYRVWETLECDKQMKQNFSTLLILLDDNRNVVKKKWFYRYKWESWLP